MLKIVACNVLDLNGCLEALNSRSSDPIKPALLRMIRVLDHSGDPKWKALNEYICSRVVGILIKANFFKDHQKCDQVADVLLKVFLGLQHSKESLKTLFANKDIQLFLFRQVYSQSGNYDDTVRLLKARSSGDGYKGDFSLQDIRVFNAACNSNGAENAVLLLLLCGHGELSHLEWDRLFSAIIGDNDDDRDLAVRSIGRLVKSSLNRSIAPMSEHDLFGLVSRYMCNAVINKTEHVSFALDFIAPLVEIGGLNEGFLNEPLFLSLRALLLDSSDSAISSEKITAFGILSKIYTLSEFEYDLMQDRELYEIVKSFAMNESADKNPLVDAYSMLNHLRKTHRAELMVDVEIQFMCLQSMGNAAIYLGGPLVSRQRVDFIRGMDFDKSELETKFPNITKLPDFTKHVLMDDFGDDDDY